MTEYNLFTDVSLNPQLKSGLGAYLLVRETFLDAPPESIEAQAIAKQLIVKRFDGVSSTRLEVLTVLWALGEFLKKAKKGGPMSLRLYTDSQCIAGLMRRRADLEAQGFRSKKAGRLLNNALLYRSFYEFHDRLKFDILKVTGHARPSTHTTIERIFSCVDRQVRKQLHAAHRKCQFEVPPGDKPVCR